MAKKKTATQEVATMEQPKETFKMMPLADILEDPNQPRDRFDDEDVQELAQSIREHGILSPLMIRDDGTDVIEGTAGNEKRRHVFRLVTGHRRKRAAELAGLVEVPVILRDLTNDQALEIQIIENLQRKDVNPMEEALAFVRLKERGYDPEEIGHRIGKNKAYVIQRMKLADLDKNFQELLYADRMTITLALKLCRFSSAIQAELWKDARVPKNWQANKTWHLNLQSYHLDDKTCELKEATFDLADADLYPEAGACTKCPHNSASNALLFPELNRKKICHQPSCFAIKIKKAYDKGIQEVMADPDVIFINASSYPGKEGREKLTTVKELGATLIEDPDDFELIAPPTELQAFDEWFEENADEDADPEKEKIELEKQYEQELAEYNKDLQEYQDAIDSGGLQKAFVVSGHWAAPEGSIVHIRLKKNAQIEAADDDGKVKAEILMIDTEIQAIKNREKRNQELDREKVFKACFPLLEEAIMDDEHFDTPQTEEEYIALIMLLYDVSGYNAAHWLVDALELKNGPSDYRKMEQLHIKLLSLRTANKARFENVTTRFIRLVLLGKMVVNKQEDYEQYGKAAALWAMMSEWIPEVRNVNTLDQEEKALKRQAKMQKRIEALEAKKANILVEAPAPPLKKSKETKFKKGVKLTPQEIEFKEQ